MFGHTGGFAGRLPCAVLLEYIVFVLVGHGTPPEAHLAQVIARTGKKTHKTVKLSTLGLQNVLVLYKLLKN